MNFKRLEIRNLAFKYMIRMFISYNNNDCIMHCLYTQELIISADVNVTLMVTKTLMGGCCKV